MSDLNKVSGNKKAEKAIFVQMPPYKDKHGVSVPKIINMVGGCVAFHRKKMMPLKTVFLCPMYYEQFKDWYRKQAVEREADLKAGLLTWDGVEIEMMGQFHIIKSNTGNDAMDWDFYPTKKIDIN